jgi:hypothetical protein
MSMSELLREHPTLVGGTNGDADAAYVAQIRGRALNDGRWEAWIVFVPVQENGPMRRTERDTTQASREAVEYWAAGVTSIYLQGALARSRPVRISAR